MTNEQREHEMEVQIAAANRYKAKTGKEMMVVWDGGCYQGWPLDTTTGNEIVYRTDGGGENVQVLGGSK